MMMLACFSALAGVSGPSSSSTAFGGPAAQLLLVWPWLVRSLLPSLAGTAGADLSVAGDVGAEQTSASSIMKESKASSRSRS
jgi:hypothetical protein